MSNLSICRICLVSGVKMYNYDCYKLKQYYEEVTAIKIKLEDPLPHKFCYECATLLHKFHKFKEKCWSGQELLNKILSNGPVSIKSISKVDRKQSKLNSALDIVNSYSRVKTYSAKNKTLKHKQNIFKKEKKISKIQEIAIKTDSDDSLDINLADYKNEVLEKERNIEIIVNIDKLGMENENTKDGIEKVELEIETNENTIKAGEEMISDIYDDRIASDNEHNEIESNDNENKGDKTKDPILYNILSETKKRKAKKRSQTKNKKKRFEIGEDKCDLDPKHWLKVILNDEEAVEEFKARAHNRKYLQAAFKCTDCFKGFSREDMLTRHTKLKHAASAGAIACRFCGMRFPRPCALSRHLAHHYTRFRCLRCDLVCDLRSTAVFHNDYHNGVIRKCEHCGHEFKHMSTYYTHLRTHRSEHVCTICGASFVSAVGLGIHTKNMHFDAVISPEEHVNVYCEKCDIKFVTRKAYEEHVYHSAKHGDSENVMNASKALHKLSSRFKLKGLRRNPRKQTLCVICNKNFSSFTACQKHQKEEHKGVPIDLGKEERRICEICGASLAAGSVQAHLNTHTRRKVFSCATCGLQFNTKSSMKRHQLVHTGEKPFECSLCEKRFTQHSSLKLHFRTAHLKQPYPKRNRRKKNPDEEMLGESYRHSEDSEENLKGSRWR